MMERKTSIESEPRTLNIRQLQCARETAMFVVSTRSTEEAMSIFTEGLEPVVSRVKQNGDGAELEYIDSPLHLPEFRIEPVVSRVKQNGDGAELEYIDGPLHLPKFRDTVSAPF